MFFDTFKDVFKNYSDVYIAETFSSIRETRTNYVFDETFGYKKYDENIKNDLIKLENVVIVFLGAGDIGNNIKDFMK